MKNHRTYSRNVFIAFLIFVTGSSGPVYANDLDISKIELGYPCPGIPFYHFRADLELPRSSIIEVNASVNGYLLRSTDLYRAEDITDLNRPLMTHRPPSGYGLSQDATLYKNPSVIGWVKWQPGQDYKIEITVRLKQTAHGSEDDIYLFANKQ